jgi:hypothetical protein
MPSAWNAQLLRLTLFVGLPVDGSGLWQTAVGEVPDVDEHRPREGVRRQAGQVGDAILELGMTAERLDWMLAPVNALAMADLTNHLGDPRIAVAPFDNLLIPWLAGGDLPVLRIAFGMVAVLPVPDRAASYARLQELVPSVTYDVERTREVLYQVNRPIQSISVPGVELNRITKWSSARIETGKIEFSGGNVTASAGETRYFVRCECDHSSPADRKEVLPVEQAVAIYHEIRDLAMGNLERGELG